MQSIKEFIVDYYLHNFNTKCISQPTVGKTTLLKVEVDKISSFTPKVLKWDAPRVPQEFTTQNNRPPRNITQYSTNQEELHGRILTKFNSMQEKSSPSIYQEERP